MTTEETRPAPPMIAGIHARYQEIAPGPTADTPEAALALARWLTFSAQRGFTRMLSPHLPMDHGEMLLMLARFEALHLLAAALAGAPGEADRLAREALNAGEDGGGIGEWLYEHGQALGVDTGEIGRLADQEAELEAAGNGKSDAERAENAERACRTLSMVVERQARDLYAAWIDVARGDMSAVRERVLNAQPDCDDNEPAEQWNGTETGGKWLERTRERFARGGVAQSAGADDSVLLALRNGGCPS